MSEEATSPFPPLPSQPPPPAGRGAWWFAWILATVIMPGAALPLVNELPPSDVSVAVCWAGAAAIVILHIVSAVKLGKAGSGCLTAGLIFGGWALMLASFFVGCVSVMSMQH